MFTNTPQLTDIMWATTLLTSVGLIISSLEWLSLFRQFGKGGIFDWKAVSLRYPFNQIVRGAVRCLMGQVVFSAVLLARLLAASWCLAYASIDLRAPLTVLVGTNLFLHFRCRYGMEGSDQMLFLLTMSLWVAAMSQDTGVAEVAVFFVAGQLVLAYFVAGVAKLYGPLWTSGTAVGLVLNTRGFGHRRFAALLSRYPRFGKGLTYTVLIFECGFPLALLLPFPSVLAFVAIGATFHLINAAFMGLNIFVWAFLATYPAIIYSSFRLTNVLYGLDVGAT